MKLLEKILVPIDVTIDSAEQIAAAMQMARLYRSEIILMYVVPEEELHDDIKKMVTKSALGILNNLKEDIEKEEVIVREPVVAFGEPSERIVQTADSENVNFIITGSGAKTDENKFKLGITAEQLVRMSDVPVWVVKTGCPVTLTNILCPVDFSASSQRALQNAILLSRNFQSELNILTVYESSGISSIISTDTKEEEDARLKKVKEEMEQFLLGVDLSEVNYTVNVVAGVVHEEILASIREKSHDLLIMGTNGRSMWSRFFMGSVTEKVTREMPCSFITTKTQDLIRLKLDAEIKEIEQHFSNGTQLMKNGLYKEAINQFSICLQINDMHIPSIYKTAEVYERMGDLVKKERYENMAKDVLSRLWDRKIEMEIRKHYRLRK